MAKKVKTPEEVRAAMEKKAAKRELFFGTFRKALALFLGIAFAFALVQIAFTKNVGGTVVTAGGTQSGGTVSGNDEPSSSEVDLAGDEPTVKEGETITDNEGNQVVGLSKADAVQLLNDATAQAAKAGYDWSRKCYYKDGGEIQVKTNNGRDATSTLNSAINTVDKNASIDSVVGGFLDITGKDEPLAAKKAKGSAAAPEGMKEKFLLKGMSLTEGDIAQFVQTGNVYKFQLNTCDNPQKDGGNALHHVTNDFVTQEEIATDIKNAISVITVNSSNIQFSDIVIVAEIADGKLKNLSMSYLMDVKSLNLKVIVTNVEGTGVGIVEENYKNFAY